MASSRKGHEEIVVRLLQAKADVDVQNKVLFWNGKIVFFECFRKSKIVFTPRVGPQVFLFRFVFCKFWSGSYFLFFYFLVDDVLKTQCIGWKYGLTAR